MAAMRPETLRIEDLHEREARPFPRSDLFDMSGRSLVLPETRALAAVELRDTADGISLRALGIIGYLPLTPSIVLNIRPKFPIENLWEMLKIADEEYDRFLPVLRSYGTGPTSPPHQILVRGFCHYLQEILRLGLARGYYKEPHKGYFRPKVNFGRTMSTYLSRGNDVYVASDSFAFSANLYPNAILKSACLAFFRLLPRGAAWSEERLLLLEALNALESVQSCRMRFGDQYLSAGLPIWLRQPYLGALTIYAAFLGFMKIGFSYDAQGCEMPSFLFSLDDIFESFVRNTFRSALRGAGLAVLDGNLSQNYCPLFNDTKQFPTKPDLIFRRRKQTIAIGEVKYKPKIEESDRYQVISHVMAAGSKLGIWISPSINEVSGMQYIGAINTGAKFYHYKINIAANLKDSQESMVKAIAALFV